MPLSTRDQERLAGCAPAFIDKLTQLFDAMEKADHPLFVVEGFRSVARQQALYAQGRNGDTRPVVTNCDGVTTKSNHQAHADGLGYAADVAFATEKPFDKNNPWQLLGETAEGLGLRWGGRFKLVDLDHVELPVYEPAKGA